MLPDWLIPATFGTLFLGAALAAQDESRPRFSSSVQAVEVYATVTDASGEPVAGLRADDFELDDDGRRQSITTFAEGAFPLTVALGVDRSLSMAGEPLRLARRAADSFLRQLRPGDRSMVVAISADADVVAPLDAPREAQRFAGHAEAPVDTERHRQREGAFGESRNCLRPSVVVELEVGGLETGDRFSGSVGDSGVDLHGLHPAREAGLGLFLGLRSRGRNGGHQQRQPQPDARCASRRADNPWLTTAHSSWSLQKAFRPSKSSGGERWYNSR